MFSPRIFFQTCFPFWCFPHLGSNSGELGSIQGKLGSTMECRKLGSIKSPLSLRKVSTKQQLTGKQKSQNKTPFLAGFIFVSILNASKLTAALRLEELKSELKLRHNMQKCRNYLPLGAISLSFRPFSNRKSGAAWTLQKRKKTQHCNVLQ